MKRRRRTCSDAWWPWVPVFTSALLRAPSRQSSLKEAHQWLAVIASAEASGRNRGSSGWLSPSSHIIVNSLVNYRSEWTSDDGGGKEALLIHRHHLACRWSISVLTWYWVQSRWFCRAGRPGSHQRRTFCCRLSRLDSIWVELSSLIVVVYYDSGQYIPERKHFRVN